MRSSLQTVQLLIRELVTLTRTNMMSLYILAECYFLNQDYPKIISLFNKHKILTQNLDFQILAAKSVVISNKIQLNFTDKKQTIRKLLTDFRTAHRKYLGWK